jgi:gentisate 1,2-dioxygenase
MQATLDALPGLHAVAPYKHRIDGGDISRTLGASAERLAIGAKSPTRRETTSAIYHVYEGTGHSVIGDRTIDWKANDTIAIPTWTPFTHHNTSDATAYLFRIDDGPVIRALGWYRADEG